MKTKYIVAAVIAMASIGATADVFSEYNASDQPERIGASQLARAEVKAEVRAEVKARTLPVINEVAPVLVIDTRSAVSRADVKAEVREAARTGTLPVVSEAGVMTATSRKPGLMH